MNCTTIDAGIATDFLERAGQSYPCENEAKEATNMLLNHIADTYRHIAGGAMGWDAILLAGGGCDLLYKHHFMTEFCFYLTEI
jgi:hypothetical protein